MSRQFLRSIKRRVVRIQRANRGLSEAASIPCQFNVDSPVHKRLSSRTVSVEGWIIPHNNIKPQAIRVKMDETIQDIAYGIKRIDVANVFKDRDQALYSGFSGEVIIKQDGVLKIEVDFGSGFQVLYEIRLTYSPELLVEDFYNPDLAKNMAEHQNLLENKKLLFYEDPVKGDYERHIDDPRIVAFYLPQFHPIPENNLVWGEGFTEWTNVTSDTPRFIGHRQPILPKDTGYYDLRLEQNIADQITRAKKHGIYGFCFYYYWFSGRRLLEKPLDSFLNHRREWDFNFTICWANENWTKRWDGRENEVIVSQKYASEDPLKFIKDVESILLDDRYIKEGDKPVLIVFRAADLRDPKEYTRVWRDYFRKEHKKELHLVSIISFDDSDPREYGFDAAIDFAPQSSFFKNEIFPKGKYPRIDVHNRLIDNNFDGIVTDYREIALNEKSYDYFNFPTYSSITPSWDNDARKKGKGFVMAYDSPDIYRQWLDNIITKEIRKTKAPLLFVNAWNEWAEGAMLEPSAHYGSAVLNRTTETLAQHSFKKGNAKKFPLWSIKRSKDTKVAVVIHLYYTERWEYIKDKIQMSMKGLSYDLFVSLNEKDSNFKDEIIRFKNTAYVQVVPNRGRDILPFMTLLPKLSILGYKAVLKLHSKKSLHRDNGLDWFEELVSNLLPRKKQVEQIVDRVTNGKEMIGPAGHFISLDRYMGSNTGRLEKLLKDMSDSKESDFLLQSVLSHGYFAGSMFWANISALEPLCRLQLLPEDFESEAGQIDGTMAHAIERGFSLLAVIDKKIILSETGKNGVLPVGKPIYSYDYAD